MKQVKIAFLFFGLISFCGCSASVKQQATQQADQACAHIAEEEGYNDHYYECWNDFYDQSYHATQRDYQRRRQAQDALLRTIGTVGDYGQRQVDRYEQQRREHECQIDPQCVLVVPKE